MVAFCFIALYLQSSNLVGVKWQVFDIYFRGGSILDRNELAAHILSRADTERMWAQPLTVICSKCRRHSRQEFHNTRERWLPGLTTKARGLLQTRIRVL